MDKPSYILLATLFLFTAATALASPPGPCASDEGTAVVSADLGDVVPDDQDSCTKNTECDHNVDVSDA